MNNDLFLKEDCPMTRTMGKIDSKWKPIIIYTLDTKTIRFGHLAEQLKIITRKVLSDELKDLENREIVVRTSYKELPPRVEYSLTEKGLALLPALQAVAKWTTDFE